jgi:hypothetical protein
MIATSGRTAYPLGYQLSQLVSPLGEHKAQLLYYLKLQGKPVHADHLWGM